MSIVENGLLIAETFIVVGCCLDAIASIISVGTLLLPRLLMPDFVR